MKKISKAVFAVIYLFLYAPLLVMIVFSFNSGRSTSVFEGISGRWYTTLFSNSNLMICFKNSLILAVASALIATAFGTLAAFGIYKLRNKYVSGAMSAVNSIPMMNPDIVTGVSMMLLFVFAGGILHTANKVGFITLLIAHITFNIPYVILNVLPKLRSSDRSLYDAARDLGCTGSKAFFKAIVPQIMPGILSGLLMAFTLSFDDFVISYYTSGPDFVTLPVYIYSLVKKTIKPDIYALYSIVFVFILLLLIVYNLLQTDSKDKKAKKSKSYTATKITAIVLSLVMVAGVSLGVIFRKESDNTLSKLKGDYSVEANPFLKYSNITLNVYNWGEYISDGADGTLDVIAAFEDLTGIKVNYMTYESNEFMYSKIKSGSVSYDVIIPSDYMIERMKNENMLREIDMSKITNYSNIEDRYKGLYYDPDEKYCVPYNVGMVGIIYNSSIVEGEPDSWELMWDERYKGEILNFNNARDGIASAQFALGLDINSENKADWDKAADKLIEQKSVLQGYVMDEIFNKMGSANAAIAPYYAGDFLTMYEANNDLKFYYPKEGTNIFVDAICIPECCQNYEAALLFINFMLEEEVAVANAEYICYATPNSAARNNAEYQEYMAELHEDWEYILYGALDSDDIFTEYYHDLPIEIRSYYETLWKKVKSF